MRLALLLLAIPAWAQSASPPLLSVIGAAYGVPPARIVAPDWVKTANFDIQGPRLPNPEQLRAELESRYAIAVRWDVRPAAVWVMRRPQSAKPLVAAEWMARGTRGYWGSSWAHVEGSWSMEDLAEFLEAGLRKPVIDETGTGGSYAISATFATHNPFDLFRTLREQTGLELTEEFRDLDVLLVERIRNPEAERRYSCEFDEYDRGGPAALLAEARQLRTSAPQLAEARSRDALKADPEFFWADLLLAELLFLRGQRAEAEAHLTTFLKACPDALDAASLYRFVEDRELLRKAQAGLERVLSRRFDDAAIASYPYLWDVRRRLWPWAEEGFRNTVQADAIRIRMLAKGSAEVREAVLAEARKRIEPAPHGAANSR